MATKNVLSSKFNAANDSTTVETEIVKKVLTGRKVFAIASMLLTALFVQAQTVHNLNRTSPQTSSTLKTSMPVPAEYLTTAKASRPFQINPALQTAGSVQKGDLVDLQLFDGQNYTAEVTNIASTPNGNFTLSLHLPDYPMAFGFITTNSLGKSLVSVNIPELQHNYVSRSNTTSDQAFLIETDGKNNLKSENDGMKISKATPVDAQNTLRKGVDAAATANCTADPGLTGSDPATISLMILYTPAAEAWAATNEGGISNTIAGAMAQMAAVVNNQGNGDAINLVYSAQIDYTEYNINEGMSTDLERLTNSSDGYMDDVHLLRKQHNADIVSLFIVNEATGGLGWVLDNATKGNIDRAFNTIRVRQASWTTTVIHEIGHNLGMQHNSENSSTTTPLYPYAYGWHWIGADTKEYGSVMSYIGTGSPYFSSPNISYRGQPTGTSTANNAQVFRNTKHTVAFYSDKLTSRPDAPANVQYSNPTNNGATITWNAVDGAKYYQLYFYTGTGWAYWNNLSNNSFRINLADYFQPCNSYEIYVKAINECGDASLESQHITFNTACSSDILPSLSLSQVFPNPAKDEIFIKSALPVTKVEIFTLTGSLLVSENNFYEKLSVSALPAGVYLIKIYTANGIYINKIVKE